MHAIRALLAAATLASCAGAATDDPVNPPEFGAWKVSRLAKISSVNGAGLDPVSSNQAYVGGRDDRG